MKRISNAIRPGLLAAGGVLLMTLLFSACKKDHDDINNDVPVAGLMGFNLSPDKPAIALTIAGSSLTSAPLAFSNFTGYYQNIYPGTREVSAYNYNSTDSAFAKATHNFEANNFYSVFTVGANGNYANVIVKDELDSTASTSGLAYVRYINAIPDSSSPVVTLNTDSAEVSNSSAAYQSVSAFKGVNPGNLSIKVSNNSNISATRTITVEKGKVYTILLIGIPGSTDTDKQVQIRFVSNGNA
jgi:hypothetical protein